jgi:hypothetical protein
MPYFDDYELAAKHVSNQLNDHHAHTGSGDQVVGATFVFPECGDCQTELAIIKSLQHSLAFELHIHKVFFMDLEFAFASPDIECPADDVMFVTSYTSLVKEMREFTPGFLEETRKLGQVPVVVVLGVNQTLKPFFVDDKYAIINFMMLCRDMHQKQIVPHVWMNYLTRCPGIRFKSWMRQATLSEHSLVVEADWEDLIKYHRERLELLGTQNLIADIPPFKCSNCGVPASTTKISPSAFKSTA